jgi:hypothetical protein
VIARERGERKKGKEIKSFFLLAAFIVIYEGEAFMLSYKERAEQQWIYRGRLS